jgi:hypothetical protein
LRGVYRDLVLLCEKIVENGAYEKEGSWREEEEEEAY